MTPTTIRLVPSGDPLALATLPTPRAEVLEVAALPLDLARRIVGASIRVCTSNPTMIHSMPEPRSARTHIALKGA